MPSRTLSSKALLSWLQGTSENRTKAMNSGRRQVAEYKGLNLLEGVLGLSQPARQPVLLTAGHLPCRITSWDLLYLNLHAGSTH